MDNPFKKRATEFFEDAVGLLSLISPEPVRLFFDGDAESHFDRLVVVVGTPGSGKTTVARLMELDTLVSLIRSTDYNKDLRALAAVLHEKLVLKDGRPRFVAYRLPAGSNLREIWELPYSEQVRHALLKSFIQARSVLGWMRKLERAGVDLDVVRLVTRDNMDAQRRLLKADDPKAFREQARQVEEEIFKIITSLIPPKEELLSQLYVATRYEAFEALKEIVIPGLQGVPGGEIFLRPMIILDDAHELHPSQFDDVDKWLRNREIKLARWLVTRVDAIGPEDFRKALASLEEDQPHIGTTLGRDRLIKLVQKDKNRVQFRGVARDVAKRYFSKMPIFVRRGVDNIERCMRQEAPVLTQSQLKELSESVGRSERDSGFTRARLDSLRALIPEKLQEDQRLAVYRILLAREKKKTPQNDMFGADPDLELETVDSKGQIKSAVIVGAEIQLMHQFDRPFYFGFDRLADCSSSNIEQFIGLAGALVEDVETKMVKGREFLLDAREQHKTLSQRAHKSIESWDFPRNDAAKKLVGYIAEKCIARTLEENAPLDDGANAFGILQSEMDRLKDVAPALVQVLHYALAYNALSLHENYECKKKTWCLFELGGLPLIAYRLPLSKGGFYEGRLSELLEAIAA